MKAMGLFIGAFHGLVAVGALALLQAIVQAFAPAWHLPFSVWWGLLAALPGLGFAAFLSRQEC